MKKLALMMVLAVLVTAGCSKDNGEKTVLEKKAVRVSVEKVKRGSLVRTLKYKGTVFPWQKANIGPDGSGRIWKIYKKQGDRVNKGELLAEMDATTLKLQEKQAEAVLAVATASYKDASLNFERLKKLFQKNAVSRMQFEKAELNLEAAATQKKSAEAGLDVIRHTLENAYMKAPFAGIITSKNHDEGDMINPMMGMSAGILTLMDLRNVKVVLDIPAEDIEKIRAGQDCDITVTSLVKDVFKGKVYSRNLAADPASKTFKVEIRIENPGIKIKAGVFAEVTVEIFKKENVLKLPLSALLEGDRVVLLDNGKAKMAGVKVGERNEREFEILDGLSEGDRVVIEGNYDLREGALITHEGENR